MKALRVFVINPGSTSTTLAVCDDVTLACSAALRHGARVVSSIKGSVSLIARVLACEEEDGTGALRDAAVRVLSGGERHAHVGR